jgi:hypothetical protein
MMALPFQYSSDVSIKNMIAVPFQYSSDVSVKNMMAFPFQYSSDVSVKSINIITYKSYEYLKGYAIMFFTDTTDEY